MIAKFKKSNRGLVMASTLWAGLGLFTLTDAQTPSSQLGKDLIGTWLLVGSPGEVDLPAAEGGRLKSITDTHWSITQADPRTGAVIFHHGGTYALKGNEYVENVEFANPGTTNLVGNAFRFNVKVDGDALTLIGLGNPWREVWKRATPSKPRKSDPAFLQGTWTGQEAAGMAKVLVRW